MTSTVVAESRRAEKHRGLLESIPRPLKGGHRQGASAGPLLQMLEQIHMRADTYACTCVQPVKCIYTCARISTCNTGGQAGARRASRARRGRTGGGQVCVKSEEGVALPGASIQSAAHTGLARGRAPGACIRRLGGAPRSHRRGSRPWRGLSGVLLLARGCCFDDVRGVCIVVAGMLHAACWLRTNPKNLYYTPPAAKAARRDGGAGRKKRTHVQSVGERRPPALLAHRTGIGKEGAGKHAKQTET